MFDLANQEAVTSYVWLKKKKDFKKVQQKCCNGGLSEVRMYVNSLSICNMAS